jgi:hypothetical protein
MIALGDADLARRDSGIVGLTVFIWDLSIDSIFKGANPFYQQRHQGQDNTVYCDLHIESAPFQRLHSTDPQIAKHWARDDVFVYHNYY